MRIIFAAGGTGGHLFPALALAKYIKSQQPDSEILFVGSSTRLEATEVSKHGFNFHGLKLKTPQSTGLKAKLIMLPNFINAVKESDKIVKEFKPDFVIGMGGFTCTSMLYAASRLKVKTIIHEQNSIAGLTNKFLNRYVDRVITCFEQVNKEFDPKKVVMLGNPRASEIVDAPIYDLSELGLDNDKKTLVIFMGSLGSKTMNDYIVDKLNAQTEFNFQIIYVTGPNYYDDINARVNAKPNLKVIAFEKEMPSLLKKVDLIMSRAGASSLAEFSAIGLPAILIPSPYVVKNHQFHNAMAFKNVGGAYVIEEKDFKDYDAFKEINELINDDQKLALMKANLEPLKMTQASQNIYQMMLEMEQK